MSAYKDQSGRWRYRFSRRGHRYGGSTLAGHNTKVAAVGLERAHIDRLERGVFTGTVPRVRDFITQFLDYQRAHVKRATVETNRVHLMIHVEPTLGAKALDEVTKQDIDLLVTAWTKKAKPRTINVRLGTIARMYALAVEWKMVKVAPDVRAIKVAKDTPRFLSEDEARRLLAGANYNWKTMMLVGLRTGLRIGELRGLQWSDLDLDRSMLRVNRSDPGTGEAAGSTKSGHGRTIPITPDAHAALISDLELARVKYGAKFARSLPVWPGAANWQGQRDRTRTRSEGGCVNAITVALRRAGIKDGPNDRLGWHTLRHTFASWLVQRGVSLRVVQELLGHASIRQTERYAHLAPDAVHHTAVATLDFVALPPVTTPVLPPGDDDAE